MKSINKVLAGLLISVMLAVISFAGGVSSSNPLPSFSSASQTGNPLIYGSYLKELHEYTVPYGVYKDKQGDIYFTGYSYVIETTIDNGTTFNEGAHTGFIGKFNIASKQMEFFKPLPYLELFGIAVDSAGNIYLSGAALSGVTAASWNTSHIFYGGKSDGVILKLDSTASNVLASNLIGGNDDDVFKFLKINSDGIIYLAGETHSQDFPLTANAISTSISLTNYVNTPVFSVLSSISQTPFYSTSFYGELKGLDIDSTGNAILGGYTNSTAFPVTAYSIKTAVEFYDLYFTKINPFTGNLIFSTLVGGIGLELLNDMTIDKAGDIYFTGWTMGDFPVTDGAFDTTFGVPTSTVYNQVDGLAGVLDSSGRYLKCATYLGGEDYDNPTHIELDEEGNILVCGYTKSSLFPVTNHSLDPVFTIWSYYTDNAFITKLDPTCKNLLYSSFILDKGIGTGRTVFSETGNNVLMLCDVIAEGFPVTTDGDTTLSKNYLCLFSLDSCFLPAEPSNLTATSNTDYSVKLSWKDNADNEDKYVIEYKLNDGPWSLLTSLPANSTSFIHNNLPVNSSTTYYYRVYAENSYGKSFVSIEISYINQGAQPRSVTNFHADSGWDGKVYLYWTNPTDADYKSTLILRKEGSPSESQSDGTVVYWYNGNKYLDTDVTNGKTYYYTAWAFDTLGLASERVYTYATPQKVSNVECLNALPGNGKVTLSWDALRSGLESALVISRTDRYPTGPSDGTVVYWYSGSTCVHKNLTNGKKYYYGVYAQDYGKTFASGIYISIIPGSYKQPVNVSIAGEGGKMNGRWSNPSTSDYWATLMMRRTDQYPAVPGDGEVRYWYNGESFTDTGLSSNQSYYYQLYSHNGDYDFSPGIGGKVNPATDYYENVRNITIKPAFQSVKLSWSNPTDSQYWATLVVRRSDRYPTAPGDGVVRYWYNGSSCVDSGLEDGKTYYYAFYAHDHNLKFAPGMVATVRTGTFANVKINVSSAANGAVSFDWENPIDTNFQATIVVKRKDRLPTGPLDGTIAYWYSGNYFSDPYLDSDQTYYYGIYSHDSNFNFAPGVGLALKPERTDINNTSMAVSNSSELQAGKSRAINARALFTSSLSTYSGWTDSMGDFDCAMDTVFWNVEGINATMEWNEGSLVLKGSPAKLTQKNLMIPAAGKFRLSYQVPEGCVITPVLLNYTDDQGEVIQSVSRLSHATTLQQGEWVTLEGEMIPNGLYGRIQLIISNSHQAPIRLDTIQWEPSEEGPLLQGVSHIKKTQE